MQASEMQFLSPHPRRQASELEIIAETLPLAGARVLELGCGKAWMTRRIAEDFAVAQLVATEVDRIQHEKNLRITDLPQIEFRYGGAQAIALPAASVDVVLMLKSLHHVPMDLMDQALEEIHRVLTPGGLAYISEPVYAGAFNDILRLFNDEKRVREAAFAAVRRSVEQGAFGLAAEIFFDAPGHYRDWSDFEQRLLKVTHTRHDIDDVLYQRIKSAFAAHLGPDGAHFLRPSRVDLLRKPG